MFQSPNSNLRDSSSTYLQFLHLSPNNIPFPHTVQVWDIQYLVENLRAERTRREHLLQPAIFRRPTQEKLQCLSRVWRTPSPSSLSRHTHTHHLFFIVF